MKNKWLWTVLAAVFIGSIAAGWYFCLQPVNPEKIAGSLATEGYDYISKRQFDLAQKKFALALNIVQVTPFENKNLLANIYLGAGWCRQEKKEWNSSIPLYKAACSELQQILYLPKYRKKRVDCLNNLYISYTWLMRAFFESGRYADALESFHAIEKLRLNEKPNSELAKIYMGMAKNAQKIKNYDFSDKCCDIGINLCEAANSREYNDVNGKMLWIKADNRSRQGRFGEAVALAKKAIAILQDSKINTPEDIELLQNILQEWITHKDIGHH